MTAFTRDTPRISLFVFVWLTEVQFVVLRQLVGCMSSPLTNRSLVIAMKRGSCDACFPFLMFKTLYCIKTVKFNTEVLTHTHTLFHLFSFKASKNSCLKLLNKTMVHNTFTRLRPRHHLACTKNSPSSSVRCRSRQVANSERCCCSNSAS